ncbi:MAG: hypothetical protein QOG38_2708 [Hyphomicrobiales bacterium]|jgi:hypothetical protein|nr:hypothetical protein [Hyphomicrobiales bacterium]
MADRRSLGLLGFLFAGVTAAVVLTAAVVVKHHMDSRVTLDARASVVVAAIR